MARTSCNVTAPTRAISDEVVTVEATVVNDANASVAVPVTYTFDGEQMTTDTFVLDPGRNTVVFEQALSDLGAIAHTVSATDTSASLETDVGKPAIFEIASYDSLETVRSGENVTVTSPSKTSSTSLVRRLWRSVSTESR